MIRNAKSLHELKTTEHILKDKKGKKLWEHINKLSGKKSKVKEIKIYSKEGNLLEKNDVIKDIKDTWHEIYKSGRKELTPIQSGTWKEQEIESIEQEYRERREKDRIEKGKIWIEGTRQEYTESKLKKGIKRLKEGKSAGPDKVKAEIYHSMEKNQTCKEVLKENFNKIITEKDIPTS